MTVSVLGLLGRLTCRDLIGGLWERRPPHDGTRSRGGKRWLHTR